MPTPGSLCAILSRTNSPWASRSHTSPTRGRLSSTSFHTGSQKPVHSKHPFQFRRWDILRKVAVPDDAASLLYPRIGP
ncbi:hypothetical protein ColKHC_13540 [Colletotrichum higginsianum]|nr:hypothetical protein ColKHC_13540 [Colletotrichum higginsianum]